jgi:hypothetical protein
MFAILLSSCRNSRLWDAFLHVSHLYFGIWEELFCLTYNILS